MTKALLVIDVQKGMFRLGEEVNESDHLLSTVKSLLGKARDSAIPVIYVQHNAPPGKPLETGQEGWEIHKEITPHPEDTIIQKTTPNSFLNTSLEEELMRKKITHLYIAGIQTEVCVDTTCRAAFSLGYKVTLLSDAHSTWDSSTLTARQIIHHHNGVLRWFADVLPCEEVAFV
ncbi:cysteine hydrolase family protein [Jeotgalibacillus proteolyticus]|uniref:cysteine hydrolase family protein n=1 Tax=Jeotgalibacillus proteolyticus TaxID=2082395 RepID=UPI003CF98696